MRKTLLLAFVFLTSFAAFGQDFSNKGKDFWVAYGYHQVMNAGGGGGNGQNMVLYFAADVASVVTVEIPGLGFTQTYNVAANTIFTTPTMPKGPTPALDARLNTNGLFDKGIHITSDFPIVAYAHIYNSSVSGATLLLPTNTLGKEYYSINYTNNSNVANSNCWFYVIATEPGTTDIEITPSADAIGHPGGVPFTITLSQGQVYNVMGTVVGNSGTDLTGSFVKSLAAGNVCKRIAVYSGSGRIYINCGSGGTSSDNYMVQSFPKAAWGKKYLTAPTGVSQARNIFRICVSDPTAQVKINGVLTTLPLINNFYYEIPAIDQPQLIESDLAVTVAQYTTTQNTCGNGVPGDPEVIYLSSVEQNIKNVLFNSNLLVNSPNFPNQPHQHWVNAIIPNGGTALSSFRIDGNAPFVSFNVHPQDPNYSYIQIPNLALGQHTLSSDSGFNAIAYGFATTESYGYNAGTNVRDLSQQLEIETTYGIETSPSVCTNAPFKFKVYFPDSTLGTPTTPPVAIRFDSLRWNLSNPALIVPNNFPIVYYGTVGSPPKVAIDSVNIRNGRQVAWYSLPTTYFFNAPGIDTLLVTGYTSTNEGCGSTREYEFPIQISDPPTASFNAVLPGCYLDSVRVTETTPQFPKTTYRQWWEFYDPVTNTTTVYSNSPPTPGSPIRALSHLFTTAGSKRIRHASITTPGCLSDTIVQFVTLPDIPNATIAGNTTVCINTGTVPVTFTGTLGTPEYIFGYTIDNGGGPGPVQYTTASSSSIFTINAPTTVAGTFVYNLVNVRNELPVGTACTRNITGQSITINVTPDATVTLRPGDNDNQTVCVNTPIVNIRYDVGGSGTGGAVSGLPSGVTGTYAAGVITITGTPTAAGIFGYTVTTTGPCLTPQATGTITVTDDATIALTSAAGSDNQTLCINTSLLVNITYAVGGSGTGGSVTGLPAGVTGVFAGGVITISGTPTAAGVFNYTVITTGPCIIPTATGTITVTGDGTLTLTSAAGTDNQTLCINIPIINITYAVGGTGTGGSVSGLPAGVTGVFAAGVITISGTPTAPGVFGYTVTTTGPCVIPTATGTITVTDDATIALTSGAGSDNQTLCINTPLLVNITYAVGGTGTGGSVSGLPAGVTGVFAGGVITISGTPTAAGVFNYTVVTTGPCVIPTATGTITVTGDGTLTLTSAAGTDNQSLCINVPITNITYAVGGTGTGGSVSGLPPGVTGVFAAGVITISGTPTSTAGSPYGYTVTTTGPCVIPSATGTITVNPDASIVLTSAAPTTSQELCRNSAITNITYAISGGGTGAGVTGLPAGVTGVFAGGVFTISGSPTVDGLFNYTVTTTGTCVQNSLSGSILVNPLPTAAFTYTIPSCETRLMTFTDASTPNVGALDQWTWDFGDASPTSPLPNPTHVYAAAGPYTVTLTVRNDKSCISNPIASIVVNIDNRPEAGFIIPDVCLSDTYAQFTDTSKLANAVIDRWDWDFGDPGSGPLNTSPLQHPTHSYSAVGLYNVRLIVWNFAKGCRDTIIQVLQVNGSNPISIFSVTNPTTLCANDSVAIVEASTVFPGVITKIEIHWDNVNFPAVFDTDNNPFTGKVYRHLYPNFQAPLTRVFQIRYRAYSGGVCVDDSIRNITVNAAPLVQFNNMPNSCYLVAPFQITQASEIGGVPGTGTYSGPGVSPTGLFSPQVAGIGTHTILYTFTSTAAGCIDTMSNTITVLDTAHAVFSVTLPSCEQVPTLFTNLSTAPATVTLLSTVWDFGDATGPQTFPIAAPISHTYTGPGPYTVTMHTVDNNLPLGCLSTDTMALINIDANHDITWDATSGSENQALCVNTSLNPIRYTLSGGASNVTFIPGLPAGLTSTLGGTPLTLTISGAPTTPSNYSFDIETSGNTCVKDLTTVTISVAPDHAIALRAGSDTAQSVCLNTPIDDIFYDLSGGATGVTISGLPTGVTYTVTGNELRIYGTPTSIPGMPDYTITTTGNTCLIATKVGKVFVHPYAVPSYTVDKPSYCIPNAIVAFTNTTTPAPLSNNTYEWNFGDGSTNVFSTHATHWYTSGIGPFTVRLTATTMPSPVLSNGQPGCASFIDVPMTTIHPQPKADFVFSKPAVCIGDNVLLTDNTDGKDGIVNQWHWDMGDGTTRLINPLTHTYGDTITYTITMYSINSLGCNSDTISKPFTVYPYPKVNAGPDKYVLEGGSVQLEGWAFGREPQYAWTPIEFLTDSRILQPRTVNPKTDMTYRLTVIGKGGCQFSDDVFVKLLKFPAIPNTFTPNGDGINDQWRIDYLNTYPNNRVQVFTRTGKLVFESRGYNTPWDGTIKGKPLPFDTYYYIIEPGNGRDPITGYVTIIK